MTEFYVGYLPKHFRIARKMRPSLSCYSPRRRLRHWFAALQRTYARSFFESGKKHVDGSSKQAIPDPTLITDAANGSALRYLLVGRESMVLIASATYVGKSVRLRGTLIYRMTRMIVLSAGSIACS